MRLLVFDPCKTNGWSFLTNGVIIGGSFNMWEKVRYLTVKHKPTVILYESFNLRAGAARRLIGSSFPAIQVIGAIRVIAEESAIKCVAQTPSQRAGIGLQRLRGFDRHARDAARHGVRYLSNKGLANTYKRYKKRKSYGSR